MSVLKCGAIVGVLWACSAAAVSAQTSGTILGRVTDPSAAVVPGATVEAENVRTGLVRVAVTDEQGDYLIPSVPLGPYKVTVTLQGFQTFIQTGINVRLNQNARVDVKLELAGATEFVTVQAEAVLVDTRSNTLGATISQRQVEELPLNGRNIMALAQMLPGVGDIQVQGTTAVGAGVTMNVSGGRPNANSFVLDGAVLGQNMTGRGVNFPNPDAIEEFQILTHNYGAEYGRAEGAVIVAATRSGTNQVRGSAWEFMRHDALNARNYFASTKPFLRQHQFGATVGGPVVRNRTFFFGSYEGLRVRQQSLITGFPATAAEQQGDFSASTRAIIDPTTGQPFPGNIIPPNRIDPLAKNMLTEYAPLPNQPDGGLQHLRSVPIDGQQVVAKVDYQFTARDRVSYRFFRNKYQNKAQGGGTSDRLAGLSDDITTSHSANYSHVFGPTLFNDLRVSYSMWDRRNVAPPGLKNPQDLGANFIANPGAAPRPPNVTVTGRMSFLPPLELITPDRFFQVDNKLVWSRSRHDIAAGFRFMRNRHGDTAYQWTSGNFRFNGAFTGNAMADFLIGRPSSYAHFSTIIDDGYTYEFHLFVSDDFRISPNVTLNLGVRYSVDTPWVQIGDRTSMFRLDRINQPSTRFPDAPPGMAFAGDPGIPRGLYPTDKNNVAPRLGVVWDPAGNGRTAIRAGYGIFYASLSEGMSAFSTNNAPFILPVSFVPPSFSDPYRGRENPFPYDFEKNPRFVFPFETIGASSDLQTGYTHQYNVTLQQQLGQDYVTTIGYVGSLGRKLQSQYDMNTAIYRPGATLANAQERRPIFPQYYAGIGVFTSDGSSQYDSLQLEFQKRLSRRYTFQLAYTLSRCTTNVAMAGLFAGGSYLQDPNDRLEGNEGPCPAEQRHVFAFNGSWDIPAPENKGVLSRILEGWALAGTVRLTSGLPVNVTSGCDCALIGADGGQLVGAQRPNQIADPKLPTDRSREELVAQYFNTAAFALPGAGQFGNAPRHSLVGPGLAQTDLALSRRFHLGLGAVQFRAEIFNLFDRVNFLNPTDPFTSPGFGRLVAARDPRIVQFGLKYEF